MNKNTIPTARQLALNILQKLDAHVGYSNYLLQEVFSNYPISLQEKAFLQEIVSGGLRQRGKLDWALNYLTDQRFDKTHPLVRNIMRLGAYQLLCMGGVASYAAVNESVSLARRFGHQGSGALVNAVLRRMSKLKDAFPFPGLEKGPVNFISVNYSHPEWLVTRWLERWGAKRTTTICQANNRPATIGLRINTIKVNIDDCQSYLQMEGITTKKCSMLDDCLEVEKGLDLSHSQAYQKGWIEIQSPVSQLICKILAPQRGERVLDLCAGRGVKSAHLVQLMKNQGQVVALDVYPNKLRQLQSNCRRLGVEIVKPLTADSGLNLPIDPSLKFEKILLDAPCSGMGILGRYPEARWQKNQALINEMQKLQSRLLENAASYLSKGGRLVYATCSLEPEENEDVIDKFLKHHPEWRLIPVKVNERQQDDLFWRSWLSQDLTNVSDGFFVAKLSKGS